MKRLLTTLSVATMWLVCRAPFAAAATCTPTGFMRDNINLTAALINPATVPATVDATGCNIGIYFDSGTANVVGRDIWGANYFGILVNGDASNVAVNIANNAIHNIGETPFNGAQHGIALYIRAFFSGFTVTGTVTGNTIFAYQKGGIVVNGAGARLSKVDSNLVYGNGHVDYIAQNGIQIGYGAMPYPNEIVGNIVTANSYIGFPGDGSASGGILVVGGPGYGTCPDGNPCPYTKNTVIGVNSGFTALIPNFVVNNDVGVYVSNLDADGVSSSPVPTGVFIIGTRAGDDICYNTSYQAGISDQGNGDWIFSNYIFQGGGYSAPCGLGIDITGSLNVYFGGNNVTPTVTTPTAALVQAPTLHVVPVM